MIHVIILILTKTNSKYDTLFLSSESSWLIAELAICDPDKVYAWMTKNSLDYSINGKAIQKICDSYRVSYDWKDRFKGLRPVVKGE